MNEATGKLGPAVDLLPDALLVVQPDGAVLDANRAALKIFGCDLGQLQSQNLYELCVDKDNLKSHLQISASATRLIPGSLSVNNAAGTAVSFRCDAALLEPPQSGKANQLLLRLVPHEHASQRFRLLTERVEQLGQQVEMRMRTEQLLDGQRQILERIVADAPLRDTLNALTEFIDAFSNHGAIPSILLYDRPSNQLRHAAAPGLPDHYCEAIDGLEAGPTIGSCGAAAFLNEPVSVPDILTHPNWAPYRELATSAGVRACFSIPITGNDNEVLGTFALYYSEARQPDPEDLRVAILLTRTAALAIERDRTLEDKARSLARERSLRSEAEDANRSKDEFLAMVSHELRNPLNAILGWSKVVTMDHDPATLEKGLAAIERNASLQARLIEEILDYSRITAGKLQLELLATDLASLVAEAIDSARPAAEAKQLKLNASLDALDGLKIGLDKARILQVLNNLLSNAIKFTPAGGEVSVDATTSARHVHIRVNDTGCGIDPKFLPYLFERFRQQDRSQQRQNEGLGLGLAISRHIVQMHHGDISAESEGHGLGSTFKFQLPKKFAWSYTDSTQVMAAPDCKGLSVLAVDDAPDTRSLLETIFVAAGAEVKVAADGHDALRTLETWCPDILLCDIGMPGMDGYEVMRRLRQKEKSSGAKPLTAIALTAYARARDRQRALDAGFDAHMAKPVDPDKLLQFVADLTIRKAD